MKEEAYYSEWRWRLSTGLLGCGTFGLADLIAHGGAQGLGVAALGAGALAFFVPQYRQEIAEKYQAIRGFAEDLPYILRLKEIPEPQEGKQENASDEQTIKQEEDVSFADYDREEFSSFGKTDTGIFFFSELLATGWRPSWKEIFVGRTMAGKDIFVPALDLCHVALAGKTGGGKGSLMRLIMVQLCFIGAPVALLNPHYMRWVKAKEGDAFDEDWSPFEGTNPRTNKPYLEQSPIDCAEPPMIDRGLTWAVEKLLESRKQRARTQAVDFVPYFIVLDEWPSIIGKLGKSAATRMGELLREGRKYRIYVIIASQDFQVKSIGIEGEGGIRKCLLTVFYTGGDTTTRRELLNEETRDTPENKIGKGVVLMRCTGTQDEVVLARVPFVDNESVYLLLGPSTYGEQEVPNKLEVTGASEKDDDASSLTLAPHSSEEMSPISVVCASSTKLPSDWKPEEAKMAKRMYQERVPKETILRLLEKRGTAATRRGELDQILQMEGEIG